ETAEKRRQRLARPRGRRDERIFAGPDPRPPERLRLGGCPELPFEPRRHRRMKSLEHGRSITERLFRSNAEHAEHAEHGFFLRPKPSACSACSAFDLKLFGRRSLAADSDVRERYPVFAIA